MKLALMGSPYSAETVAVVREAERLGFDSVWTAENYGPDAFTPAAWLAAQTSTIMIGTIAAIVDARAPAMTAMSAMTLDALSSGRFTLGIGTSGPAVVEGWYGKPFARPLARTREYVAILRQVMARQEAVRFEGSFYQLPLSGGAGRPLKSVQHPTRPHQPIMIAAEGPKNVALAAEIADGWTAFYLSPQSDAYYRRCLADGFARRPGGCPNRFEILGQILLAVDDDLDAAADLIRPHVAMMVGAMGSPAENFHYNALARIGYEAECVQIHERWRQGDRAGAAAAVPTRMVEGIALIGSFDKIRHDLAAWRETAITTLLPVLTGAPMTTAFVRRLAELVR